MPPQSRKMLTPVPIAIALIAAEVAGVAVPAAVPPACPEAHGDEIVVCRRAPVETDRFRLRQQLPDAPSALPKAEWGLGGGVRMGIEASAVGLAPGIVSNRAMVKLKVPF